MSHESISSENKYSLGEILRSLNESQKHSLAIILRLDERLRDMSQSAEFSDIRTFSIRHDASNNIRGLEWDKEYGFMEPFGEPLTAMDILNDYIARTYTKRTQGPVWYFSHMFPDTDSPTLRRSAKEEIRAAVSAPLYAYETSFDGLFPKFRANFQNAAAACIRGEGKLRADPQSLLSKAKEIAKIL